jgi:hypothetical protein
VLTHLPNRVRRPFVVQLLLALSLLMAQGAAQAHVYSHLKSGSNTSDFSATAGQLCGLCLCGAPLLSAAGGSKAPHVFVSASVAAPVAVAGAARAESPRYYAFRSRAPPSLL